MAAIGCSGIFVAGGLPHASDDVSAALRVAWGHLPPAGRCQRGSCAAPALASCAGPVSTPQGACVPPRVGHGRLIDRSH